MKKRLIPILLAMVLLTGCAPMPPLVSEPIISQPSHPGVNTPAPTPSSPAQDKDDTEPAPTVTPPAPSKPVQEDEKPQKEPLFPRRGAIHQYGEDTHYLYINGSYTCRVIYPAGTSTRLTREMQHWIEETSAKYEKKSADASQAKLSLSYESHLVNEELVGVKLYGTYYTPEQEEPEVVIVTFNGPIGPGDPVTLDKILDNPGKDSLRSLARTALGIEPGTGGDVLKNWLFTDDGIEVTILQDTGDTGKSPVKSAVIPYDKLSGIIDLEAIAEKFGHAILDPDKPMIALTFDDGPSAHTERLLNIFKEYGGHGTFFVVGNLIEGREDTVRRAVEEGHEVGSHGWNHPLLTSLSEEKIKEQLQNTKTAIEDATGVEANLLRPPYGSHNQRVRDVAAELGISLINWSVDTLDWKNRSATWVYDSIMGSAYNGAIILCHDLHKTTVDAMESVIPALIASGYQLVTVTELLTSQGGELEPGTMYYQLKDITG